VLHRQGRAFLETELLESLVAQAQLVPGHQRFVANDVEHRQQCVAVGAGPDLRQRLESLGPVDFTVAVHVGHVLMVGVHGDMAQLQSAGAGFMLVQFGFCHAPFRRID
jgi:hypothetical protein